MTHAFFSPETGTPEEWNEAIARVEDYLRANRIYGRMQQLELVSQVIARAAERHADMPKVSPTVIAVDEARELLNRRLARLVENTGVEPERAVLVGRVTYMLVAGNECRPEFLLDDAPVPEELRKAVRTHVMRSGPDISVSTMVPRPIDLGLIPNVAEYTWDLLERLPILRMLFLWTIFALMMAALFFLIRGNIDFVL